MFWFCSCCDLAFRVVLVRAVVFSTSTTAATATLLPRLLIPRAGALGWWWCLTGHPRLRPESPVDADVLEQGNLGGKMGALQASGKSKSGMCVRKTDADVSGA